VQLVILQHWDKCWRKADEFENTYHLQGTIVTQVYKHYRIIFTITLERGVIIPAAQRGIIKKLNHS
jgi:hypothetical protein